MRKENTVLWLEQLNASLQMGLLPLPQDSCAMLGKSKAAMQGVTKNPTSTGTYPQQLLSAEIQRI